MKVYKSKVDLWLAGLIIGSLMLPLFIGLVVGEMVWPAIVVCGFSMVLVVWLFLATRYEITGTDLKVHAGLYKINIPINSITSVEPSRDPLSSPAFSLDRLKISYGKNKTVLISPKDKGSFLNDIGWA